MLKAGDWRSLAWPLERAYPAEFARPEVALNLIQQNNTVENHLTINIYERYRPQALGNGKASSEAGS